MIHLVVSFPFVSVLMFYVNRAIPFRLARDVARAAHETVDQMHRNKVELEFVVDWKRYVTQRAI